jgi:hypothetical protein
LLLTKFLQVSGSSSSPCHTCGAVRAKATRGCGVKGQKVVTKGLWFMVFNATFNNISFISWQSVLLVDEIRVPRENH